jgi:hypothetical protein
MELALIAGIGLIGSTIINKLNNNNSDPITEGTTIKHKLSSNSGSKEDINKKIRSIEENDDKGDVTYNNGYQESNNVKLFPTEFNSKTHHLYDTIAEVKLKNKYYDMASDQREKSKIPERTNIIPPYYNQPYQNREKTTLTMGPVPTVELNDKKIESFMDQFNLQTINNRDEPKSIGDTSLSVSKSNKSNLEKNLTHVEGFSPFDAETLDMTYGITPKENFHHNNEQFFTAKRDLGITEKNNFEYPMEIFTGSSKNWNPKRETLPFFDPEEYKENPFGTKLVVDEERDRMIVGRQRQNERPFEPVKVPPGVNLDYDEMPKFGFHDPVRILPYDTNETRVANKPKETYEDRVKGPPKKGEKRGVTAPVIKRRPQQFRYQDVDDFVPNRAVNTADPVYGDWESDIHENARTATTTTEMDGPAGGPSRVGGFGRDGEKNFTVLRKVRHVEDKLGPRATDRYTTNPKSYNILLNERNTTNYDETGNAINHNQGHVGFDPNDIAKGTKKQTLTEKQFNTMISRSVESYANLTDEAKSTIKQIIATKSYQQIMSGAQHNAYSNLTDEAKQTLKQMLTVAEFNTNVGSNEKGTYAEPQDIANTTLKELLVMLEQNTHMGPAQKETYVNLSDLAKTTGRQTIEEKEFNTVVRQLVKSYANLTDESKTTLKELLTSKEFNTHTGPLEKRAYANLTDEARLTLKQLLTLVELNTQMGPAQKETYVNLTDTAKTTGRQTLTEKEFNTFLFRAMQSYSNLTDNAKTTIKQILSTQKLNTIMGSLEKGSYVNLTDEAKTTLKQLLSEKEFNTIMGSADKKSYVNLTDEAKTTLKQLLSEKEFNTMMGSADKKSYVNFTDEAKSTLRQLLTLLTFSNFMKQNPGTYANLNDDAKVTLKQLLTMMENNTHVNSAEKGTYASLQDLAKKTIKEFLAVKHLNNNVGTVKRETAIDYDDTARITHKQDLLNENYMGTLINSAIGTIQEQYDIPMTMKDMTKILDYMSAAYAAGVNRKPRNDMAERNMRQNIAKEKIAEGRYPTLSGPKLIPTRDNYDNMRQRDKPNYNRANPPTLLTKLNLEDRQIFGGQKIKRKINYDERLYKELLGQLDDNPLVNNIQTNVRSTFRE